MHIHKNLHARTVLLVVVATAFFAGPISTIPFAAADNSADDNTKASSGNPAIPDDRCRSYRGPSVGPTIDSISSAIYVQDEFEVDSVTVEVNLRHRQVGTIEVAVERVGREEYSAHEVLLKASGRGRRADDMQCTVFDSNAEEMIPDDQATAAQMAPFCGRFQPSQTLKYFAGQLSAGTWMLNARDVKEFRERRPMYLSSWTLTLCEAMPSDPPPPMPLSEEADASEDQTAVKPTLNEENVDGASTLGMNASSEEDDKDGTTVVEAPAPKPYDLSRQFRHDEGLTSTIRSAIDEEGAPPPRSENVAESRTQRSFALDLPGNVEDETPAKQRGDENIPNAAAVGAAIADKNGSTASEQAAEKQGKEESSGSTMDGEAVQEEETASDDRNVTREELNLIRTIAGELAKDVEEVFWETVAGTANETASGEGDTGGDVALQAADNIVRPETLSEQVLSALQQGAAVPQPYRSGSTSQATSDEPSPTVKMQSGPPTTIAPRYTTLADWPYASASYPNVYTPPQPAPPSQTRSVWGQLGASRSPTGAPLLPILPFASAQYHHLMKLYASSSHTLGIALGKLIAADYAKKYHLYAILFTPGTTLHHRLKTALHLLKTPAYKSVRIQFVVLSVATGYLISLTEVLGLDSMLEGVIDPEWIIKWDMLVEDIFDRLGLQAPGKLVRSFVHKLGSYEEALARDLLPMEAITSSSSSAHALSNFLDMATAVMAHSNDVVEDFEELLDAPEVRRLANINLGALMVRGMIGMLGKDGQMYPK